VTDTFAALSMTAPTRPSRRVPVTRFYSVAIVGGGALRVRDELPLSNVTITERLKGAGSLSGSIPNRHPKATPANLETENTLIVAERDGVVIWAGPLVNIDLGIDANNLSLQAEGAWNLVRRRVIRSSLAMPRATMADGEVRFAQAEQFHIVSDLISHMNAIRNDLGITVQWDEAGTFSAVSGVLRDRTYEADKGKSIGEAIEQLSDVQGGFDWALEPQGTVDNLSFHLRLHHPYRGRDTGYRFDWVAPRRNTTTTTLPTPITIDDEILTVDDKPLTIDVPDKVLPRTSRTGSANVLAVGLSESSRERVARFSAIGPGEGVEQIVAHAIASDAEVLPLTEGSGSWQDVTRLPTLQSHADRAIQMNSRRVLVPSVRLDPQAHPQLGSWIVGDIFDVSIDDGWAQLPEGKYRSIGRSYSIDADGAETVDVDLVHLGVWDA
jgi:hypothetical protein